MNQNYIITLFKIQSTLPQPNIFTCYTNSKLRVDKDKPPFYSLVVLNEPAQWHLSYCLLKVLHLTKKHVKDLQKMEGTKC